MTWFFANNPKILYEVSNSNIPVECMDITKRFKLRESVAQKKYILFNYQLREGERPDMVADFYYGDPTLDWLVLITNNIFDPYFEWPLTHTEFTEFVKLKYGSVEYAKSNYKEYYKILQPRQKTVEGYWVDEYSVQIDQKTYQSLTAPQRKRVSFYDYENSLNESKKVIKVIDKRFLDQILKELDTVYE